MIIAAFMDRGALPQKAERAMCVACCIFKRSGYGDFVRKWRKLHRPLKVSAFHATDFYTRGGDYRGVDQAKWREVGRCMPHVINGQVLQVLAISFREDEFWRIAGDEWRSAYGDSLYSAAVQLCVGATGYWCDRRQFTGRVRYFLESGEEDQAAADAALRSIARNPRLGPHARYLSHAFINKGDAPGLEAADYFAWHWNKYHADTLYKYERRMRADFRQLVMADPDKYAVYHYTDDVLRRVVKFYLDRKPLKR